MPRVHTLGDACSKIVDCAHKTAPIDQDGQYFAVGTPAMRGNTIDYSQARRISKDTFDQWTTRLRPEFGDLLLAREAPVGPVVRVPEAENVAPGQRTVLLRPRPGVVESRFLYYYLTSPSTQSALQVKASGSTVPHLNVADVRLLPTPGFPDYLEQQAITEVLGALDDKIAANSKIIAVTQGLLAARVASLRIGYAPDAGEAAGLLEFVELNPRTIGSLNGAGATYLEMKNLPSGAMTVSQWSSRIPQGGARFQNGDTLLARITPCLENGKAGYVDFLQPDGVGVGSTEFIVMRPLPGIPRTLPYFLATDDRFREFAIRHMVGTTGRQRLVAKELSKYELCRPDDSELAALAALEEALMPRLKAAVDESRVLSVTRDELLPLLMSGKVRVREAEKAVEGVV